METKVVFYQKLIKVKHSVLCVIWYKQLSQPFHLMHETAIKKFNKEARWLYEELS